METAVVGFLAFFGVGSDCEFGAQPGGTRTVLDLYWSSGPAVESTWNLIVVNFPGFLKYCAVGPMRSSSPGRNCLSWVTSSVLKRHEINGSGNAGPEQKEQANRHED